jgi:diguanylate cyclase (GGDEF)-like protein
MARTPAEFRHRFAARWRPALDLLRQGCALDEPYRRYQGELIRRRMRSLAVVVGVLAVAWIPIDLSGLAPEEFVPITVLRLLLAGAMAALVLNLRRLPPLSALAVFIVLQCVAFGAMQAFLRVGAVGAVGVLRVGYGLFPFVVAAQLAIFPVSWACALRLALPIALLLSAPMLGGDLHNGAMLWNMLWLLVLLLALSSWASNAQLSLMRELLHARRDASHDALTGLFNRRAASERLVLERARAERQRAALSVLMLDIDHFKRINDRWGHAAGDGVLLAVADVLRHELRASDLGVRHGGEEFLVILPGDSAAQAFEVAERIRGEVAQLAVPLDGDTASITVSVGIATFNGSESGEQLVARADAALYRAKQGGRNRSVLADLDQPTPLSTGGIDKA